MKRGNMNWLLWKEYRQNRFIVYVALCLLARSQANSVGRLTVGA